MQRILVPVTWVRELPCETSNTVSLNAEHRAARQNVVMKKLIAVALIFGLYQNWGSINNFVFGPPNYANAGNEVVLYATEWCGYCQKTRELFAAKNIPYVEYDIEKSAKRNREYKQLGGSGVPVVNANGTIIYGYAPDSILAAMRSN